MKRNTLKKQTKWNRSVVEVSKMADVSPTHTGFTFRATAFTWFHCCTRPCAVAHVVIHYILYYCQTINWFCYRAGCLWFVSFQWGMTINLLRHITLRAFDSISLCLSCSVFLNVAEERRQVWRLLFEAKLINLIILYYYSDPAIVLSELKTSVKCNLKKTNPERGFL